MVTGTLLAIVVVAALGCGLMAGAFFVFSVMVMPALRRLAAPEAIAAMQSINVVAVTPAFMLAMFGTAAACIAVIVGAVADWEEPRSFYLVGGASLYLVGVVVLTGTYHVPRNNRLAEADPASPEGADRWADYLREWTRWNHVRAAAALAAAAVLTVAMRLT